jgi:hypothetical protein
MSPKPTRNAQVDGNLIGSLLSLHRRIHRAGRLKAASASLFGRALDIFMNCEAGALAPSGLPEGLLCLAQCVGPGYADVFEEMIVRLRKLTKPGALTMPIDVKPKALACRV